MHKNGLTLEEALRILSLQEEVLSEKEKSLSEKDSKIKLLEEECDHLKEQLAKLLHKRYGKKSEKMPEEDYPVADEPKITETEAKEIEAAEQEIKVSSHSRKKPKRKPLPADFKRDILIHDLPLEKQICAYCQGSLHCIGEETSEKLDYIPAQIKVIRQVRKKYGCRGCESGVSVAEGTPDFLPKSLAAPGLLAHVILSKYEDHCPLYRQEHIWQRLGVDIPRSTLCNWMLLSAERLMVLMPLLKEEIIQGYYARADETPVQVLEENKVRTSKKAYMWVFTSGRPERAVIVYQFAMSRHGETAEQFFKGFKGHLQTDGFSGYNKTAEQADITQICCWAHGRRKFVAITKLAKQPGAAHYAVLVIAKLYKIEKEIKEKQLNFEQTKNYREKFAKPILEEFKVWLEDKKLKAPPKSPLGLAISYILERWSPLTEYLKYGFLDIDNNFGERCIRPFTIGRKNWIFMGNERGGQAASVFYSLIETAKSNQLNTYAYFRYLMTVLPTVDPNDQEVLRALLPNRITQPELEVYLK